jgi:hypothetical protein
MGGRLGGNGGSATNTFYGYADASPEELRGFTWDQPNLETWWNQLGAGQKLALVAGIAAAVGGAIMFGPALAAMGAVAVGTSGTGAFAAIAAGSVLTAAQTTATMNLVGSAFLFVAGIMATGGAVAG